MDSMVAAQIIEDKLVEGGYCGRRIGSGFDFGSETRDFQYEIGSKTLTEEIIASFVPDGFVIRIKFVDDWFSVRVTPDSYYSSNNSDEDYDMPNGMPDECD